jgi:hypothetical protein
MAVTGMEQTINRDPALFYWILGPITLVMASTQIPEHPSQEHPFFLEISRSLRSFSY